MMGDPMTRKIAVRFEHVDLVFGPQAARALALLRPGLRPRDHPEGGPARSSASPTRTSRSPRGRRILGPDGPLRLVGGGPKSFFFFFGKGGGGGGGPAALRERAPTPYLRGAGDRLRRRRVRSTSPPCRPPRTLEAPARQGGVAMVFQQFALLSLAVRVAQNVGSRGLVGERALQGRDRPRRSPRSSQLVGLSDWAVGLRARGCRAAMQQRVGLARAFRHGRVDPAA